MSEPIWKTFHMGLSVRGALSWGKRDLKKIFVRSDGKHATADEAREKLMDELSQGHEMIPMGEPCEGWDYKTGCPGHEKKETK